MIAPLPVPVWEPAEFHRQLMHALDDAFDSLATAPTFQADWTAWRTVPGTKTQVRQSPMLGNGGPDREAGGFHLFARRYVEAEQKGSSLRSDRCSFERYQDFAFSTGGNWYHGKKLPIMIAECESNSRELLGELSGLLAMRCPLKYLFISGRDTLSRLNAFCDDPASANVDWGNTTLYVIEIPNEPSRPSTWTAFRASVRNTGESFRFESTV